MVCGVNPKQGTESQQISSALIGSGALAGMLRLRAIAPVCYFFRHFCGRDMGL